MQGDFMKRLKVCKAALIGTLILTAFAALSGCGRWNKPVDVSNSTVSATSPDGGGSAVGTGNKLTATFSEPMDPTSFTADSFTLQHGGTRDTGTVSYSGVTAVFTPQGGLAPNTIYTAMITTGVRDLGGHPLADNFSWSFTTGASATVVKPTVSSTTPADAATGVPTGNQVGATFSSPMDPLTISASTFTLKRGAVAVAGRVASSGVNATFTPTSALLANTVYSASISTGAKDLAGNALAANFNWSFTTGAGADLVRPTVTLTFPADGAVNVAADTTITATFSEAMDPLTFTSQLP